MAKFSIVCKDGQGQTVREVRFSTSREALLTELRTGGLIPISLQTMEGRQEKAGTRETTRTPLFGGKVKLNEVAVGFRMLATLLGGGLPIIDALVDVAEQSGNARLREILIAAATDVRKGSSLSEALARFPRAFSPMVQALVQAGEESGNLTQVLGDLAEYLEAQVELRRQIKAGTRYPIFIVCFFVLALSVILLYILPKFKEIFDKFDAELPMLTKLVMSVSAGIVHNLIYVLPAIGLVAVGVSLWKRTEGGRRTLDAFWLKVPVIGKLVHQIAIGRFARVLSLLMESGIPVVEALKLSARVPGNVIIGEQVDEVRQSIVRGASLSEEFAARPCFPRMLVRMTSAGEASGRLGDMLNRVADHYVRESAASIEGLMSMLEPALLVLLGIVVGFVVIAIYFPIFNLAKVVA